MERMKPQSLPGLGAKELALVAAIMTLAGGCADHVKKCLGDRGEGKKKSVASLVEECDEAVDKYAGTSNSEISEDPGIDSKRFRDASEACRLASIRAAQLFGDLRGEAELAKGDKKESCLKAKSWAKARNAEANADAKRLHRKQF